MTPSTVRAVPHYMKNVGDIEAALISYAFPDDWAEASFVEPSRQNQKRKHDIARIEGRFGVVYI